MEHRKNNKKQQKMPHFPHPPISHWIEEKVIFKKKNNSGPFDVKLKAVIERPKFTNGELGFYRVMTTITVGNYHVRLPTKSLLLIMEWIGEKHDALSDAIKEVHELNEKHGMEINQTTLPRPFPQPTRSSTRKVFIETKKAARRDSRRPDGNVKPRKIRAPNVNGNIIVDKERPPDINGNAIAEQQ